MPPAQFSHDTKYPMLEGGLDYLSETNRTKLIDWVKNLEVTYSTEKVFIKKKTNSRNTKSESKFKNFDFKLDIPLEDDRITYRKLTPLDTLTMYSFSPEMLQNTKAMNSLVGYTVNAESSVHHIEVQVQTAERTETLFSWSAVLSRKILFSNNAVRSYPSNSNLKITTHHNFQSTYPSVLKSAQSISLYLSKSKNNTHLFKIDQFNAPYKNILNNTYSIDKKINLKFSINGMYAHMHQSGSNVIIQIYRPLLKDYLDMAEIYGWIADLKFTYTLKKPIPVKNGDVLRLTCNYKETKYYKSIGWGLNEEMCSATFLTQFD